MTIIKLLAKKQISRQLFRLCRLHGFENKAQIEHYFWEHGSFEDLKWSSPEELEELENLIDVPRIRFAIQWEIPLHSVRSGSLVSMADLLLKEKLLSRKQLEVLLSSFRIYRSTATLTPSALADRMKLTPRSVLRLRKLAIGGILKGLPSLQGIQEDLLQQYALDSTSEMIIIDEAWAQEINTREKTNFTSQFLGLLFGLYLEDQFTCLGRPEEVLAGNYLGIRHFWSGFYLVRKDLSTAIDLEELVLESFRLKHGGGVRSLDFRAYISHFIRDSHSSELELLLPIAEEVLFRELGLRVKEKKLLFPPRKEFLLCTYSRKALEILGKPSRLEVIRRKVEELQPGVVVDSNHFALVLLEKWGFTSYKGLYGLKKWFKKGKGKLKHQDPALLEDLSQLHPVRTGDYWKLYWDQKFAELQAFTDMHDRLPERNGPVQEKKLFNWLKRQMTDFRKGKLDPGQLARYKEFRQRFPIRSGRYWAVFWNNRLAELKDFAQTHSRPPRSTGPGEEGKLYKWLVQQKVDMKKGKLNQFQKTHLREFLGQYPLRAPKPKWETRFYQLVKFVETYSRLPGKEADEEERLLSYFWHHQLQKMKQGKLSSRQQALLKDIKRKYPYNSEHHRLKWHKRFTELKEFAEAHGVPRGRNCTGVAKTLRGWLIMQRVRMKNGELDLRQQQLLKDFDAQYQVNGENYLKTEWDQKFRELEDFVKRHSRLPKNRDRSGEEKVLYNWYAIQRYKLKRRGLDAQQQELLIDFMDRNPVRSAAYLKVCWYDRLEELEQFAKAHSRLPKSTKKEDRPLYTWLNLQRRYSAEGKLDSFQQAKFQELVEKYPENTYLEKHWNGRYKELGKFIELHSRLPKKKAPPTERSLHYWCMKYLKKLDKGKLDPQRARSFRRLTDPYRRKLPAWEERFGEVKAFALKNLRLPKRTAITKEERALNRWFQGQKERLKKGRLDKGQQEQVRDLVSRYGTGPGRSKPKVLDQVME